MEVVIESKTCLLSTLTLAQIILHQNIFFNFINWCAERYCQENIHFWLVLEGFKLCNVEHIQHVANEILERFIDDEIVTFNENGLLERLRNSAYSPTLDMFKELQNHVWWLIENDSWNKYKNIYHLKCPNKMSKKKLVSFKKQHTEIYDLYQIFRERTLTRVKSILNYSPSGPPERRVSTVFEEIWFDEEFMKGFFEFLFRKDKGDYFKFYVDFVCAVHEQDDSSEIYEKFADNLQNLDIIPEKVRAAARQRPSNQIFLRIIKMIENDIKHNVFPDFLCSLEYFETNDGSIEYSNPDLQSEFIENYREVKAKQQGLLKHKKSKELHKSRRS
jgi:hypothetical protein